MNRRNFLSLAALAIAGKAAERVFPFRVYSIPKEIVIAAELPPYPWIEWSTLAPSPLQNGRIVNIRAPKSGYLVDSLDALKYLVGGIEYPTYESALPHLRGNELLLRTYRHPIELTRLTLTSVRR